MPDTSTGEKPASYRLYFLDPQDGRILSFQEIMADSDTSAIEQAEQRRDDKPMELWCRARKVQDWPAQFAPPSQVAKPQSS